MHTLKDAGVSEMDGLFLGPSSGVRGSGPYCLTIQRLRIAGCYGRLSTLSRKHKEW